MKIQFEIKNRAFFFAALIVSFAIIIGLAIAITAPNPGHTSNDIQISTGGTEKTLQSFIDSDITWFGNIGIFLKNGATATTSIRCDDYYITGDSKKENNKTFTRVMQQRVFEWKGADCDSGWTEGLTAQCGNLAKAITSQNGVATFFNEKPCSVGYWR